ncbi:MAG: TRAP transporter substrate-binding protein DctP [Arhodomonas sp.]|nr:TRAP transporter substrate-binding protein DctP [Arhodomonas sp.]
MNDTIDRLGGSPVPMAATEVYTSLERGVIEGAAGFEFVTAVSYQLHEVAPHFTDIGAGPHAPAATVISMRAWESLPKRSGH